MPTPEQTLQTLANLHPDYPTFAKNFPTTSPIATIPLPPALAADILTFIKTESHELSHYLQNPQPTQPTKLFPGAETILPWAAALFLLRAHIKIDLPNFTLEHQPMGDELLAKIFDTINKYFGK